MAQIVQVCNVALVVLILLSGSQVSEQASTLLQDLSRFTRAIDAQEEKCTDNTACGWAIYKPFTRAIENYMRNTCTCPEHMKCIRTDDDLSISAFVYRCRKMQS
ncbi:uncharacterized protein LOC131689527 [Topomyia yanbarensis]|uniref:uncharacterized protein LOC131689527 n=1 Tax=Topomyia yanbarensis TaxID=2498891 RepID=UPI00273B9F1B|nr:uncharacterized protein LOC131689527 [Topomyia yanbarensis]